MVKHLFTKWFKGLIEFLVIFPVIFLISIFVFPYGKLWIGLISLPLFFLIGIVFSSILTEKNRAFYILFAILIGLIPSLLMVGHLIAMATLFLLSIVIIYRGMLHAEHRFEDVFPGVFMWSSYIILYVLGFWAFHHFLLLQPYLNIITWMGSLVLILILFIANDRHLRAASLSQNDKPIINKAVKARNRYFIGLTVMVIFFIANFQIIESFLLKFLQSIIKGIFWIMTLFGGKGETDLEQAPKVMPKLPMAKQGGHSHFAEILQKILEWFVYGFLVVLSIVFLVYLHQKLKVIFKRLFKKISDFLKQIAGSDKNNLENWAFTDEKESVIDWREWRVKGEQRVRDFIRSIYKREPKWHELSNEEKVRELYRNLLKQEIKQGNKIQLSATPHEFLLEWVKQHPDQVDLIQLSETYGDVRYGLKRISNESVERLFEMIKKE